MFIMTNVRITEILCSLRLVIEGKTEKGKEIPDISRLEFLEQHLANNFALSDAEDSTSGPLNRGGLFIYLHFFIYIFYGWQVASYTVYL